MSEAHFSLIFRGPAVDHGEIDVNDFAPALLAVGDLMQATNDRINGDRVEAVVKVRTTAKGSFWVDLILQAQSAIEGAKPIFDTLADQKDGIAAAKDLSDLVFKVGGGLAGTGGGLFFLLKWLRGRKPDKIEEKGGDVQVHIGDTYFITNQQTIELAQDVRVREHAKRLVDVLNREGMESLSAKRADEKQELQIERTDVPSFEIPEEEEEPLQDEIREMNLQIISLSFKEDNKWRLTDGAEPFSAAIEDVDFLNKIANAQVRFAKNDCLRCEVRERQARTTKGLKKERTIIRVIEHTPAARQLRLV